MKKMNFDRWMVVIILILLVVIIAEGISIKILTKKKEGEQAEEESNIVLYRGCEIAVGTGNQNPLDFSTGLDESSNQKYNTTYYNYENGLYKGETQGEFKYEEGGYNEVHNVSKIAMTKKFNAIPRAVEKVDAVPTPIKEELSEYDTITADQIDIDGDGTKEYFVCVQDLRTEKEKPVAFSAIMLYSHDGAKIRDLVTIEDGVYKTAKSKSVKNLDKEDYTFISLDNVEYIDLDDDNIMEVLIDVPQYEEMLLSIFNYSAYTVSGEETVIESVNP